MDSRRFREVDAAQLSYALPWHLEVTQLIIANERFREIDIEFLGFYLESCIQQEIRIDIEVFQTILRSERVTRLYPRNFKNRQD
jgi:hypothetical protein